MASEAFGSSRIARDTVSIVGDFAGNLFGQSISMFLLFLGGLMGYELLHSMWGYQQPSKPAGILVEGIAKMFGVSGEK